MSRNDLLALIEAEAAAPVPPGIRAAADAVRRRHGPAASAVLFYGSCRREGEYRGGVVDFYLLVDRYRDAYASRTAAALNALLPPNVYYLEVPFEDHAVRVKCAVASMRDFMNGASAFQPWIWPRFAQPCTLVWARDAETRMAVLAALATAAETTFVETAPLAGPSFTPRQLWVRAFAESYACELRAERPAQAEKIYAAAAPYYEGATRALLSAAAVPVAAEPDRPGRLRGDFPAPRRTAARLRWALRRVVGKTLSLLRLAKAAFTFEGAVDYVVWKLERHSGARVEVTPWQRRHPVLAAPVVMWRLYRQDILR